MFRNFTKQQKKSLGVILLFSLVAIGMLMAYLEVRSREKHSILTTGQIYDVTTLAKSPEVYVRYRYTIGDKQYNGLNSLPATYKSEHLGPLVKLLLNRSFPVVYDKTDSSNSEILVSNKQCKRYRFVQPDSLRQTFLAYDSIVKKPSSR